MTLLDHPLVDIDELEKLAEAATPGPWVLLRHTASGYTQEISSPGHGTNGTDKIVECLWGCGTKRGQNDYSYIAALDPQTLLALTKVVRVGYLAENALANLLENPQFTVAVGGNPLVVDGMLANARIALERLRDSLKAVRAGV